MKHTEPTTKFFATIAAASLDALARNTSVWRNTSNWTGSAPYASGSYDGLIDDICKGHGYEYVPVEYRKIGGYPKQEYSDYCDSNAA